MKKKTSDADGRNGLEEAIRQLTQAQATLTQVQATYLADMSVLKRQSDERFARIEADIGTILRVLAEHGRILQDLPEAVRDKIGFKPQS